MELDGVWRTIGGRRVFIKTGQSLSDAMKESGKFPTQNIRKPLTDDEEYAINKYIGSYSYIINEKLRNGELLNANDLEFVEHYDKALDKMPVYEGVVYRSIVKDESRMDDFLKNYAQGNEVTFPAYTSASVDEVYDSGMEVQYIIKSKFARDIRKYNEDENEVVFKRGAKFMVASVKLNGNKAKIELEEKT